MVLHSVGNTIRPRKAPNPATPAFPTPEAQARPPQCPPSKYPAVTLVCSKVRSLAHYRTSRFPGGWFESSKVFSPFSVFACRC